MYIELNKLQLQLYINFKDYAEQITLLKNIQIKVKVSIYWRVSMSLIFFPGP